MWYSRIFLNLYSNILDEYLITSDVLEEQVTLAIEHMHEIYLGDPKNFSKSSNFIIDFNKVAYQCAYMHKYAPFHTALVYEVMNLALVHNPSIIRTTLNSIKGPLEICSLGCGPGTDAIGALTAMHDKLGFFPSNVQLIDIVSGWEKAFQSVVKELQSKNRNYGILSESTSKKYFDWSFLTADLQKEMNSELDKKLGRADLITLIKFVSAAACKETRSMIEKIFELMKPGALILFIDNAAGGFQQLISDAALEHKCVPVFGPLNHELYVNDTFIRERFGYKSCYQTRVSVQFLKKTNLVQFSNEMPRFQCNNLLVLPNRYWPEHKTENNISFNNFDLSNRSFGCESPWYGQTINFNNSYLSPNPEYRFQNECYSGNDGIPWGENAGFGFNNNYVPRKSFGFESINSPNSFISPDSFEHRLDYESELSNFSMSKENDFRYINSPCSPDSSSPLPYRYKTQRTVVIGNMNNNYLNFQRRVFNNESPLYNSSISINNYYSSPDLLDCSLQGESKIQDISMSQIDNYSAFRGKSFEHPSQNSSGHESLTSTPRSNVLLPTPYTNRPLIEIDNAINSYESFERYQQSSNYVQSPVPIRKRNITILKQRRMQKPYIRC